MPHARVFVLDDHPLVLAQIGRLLEDAGYEVDLFDSAAALLRAPSPEPPCCLLLDLEMPGMSGLDVQRKILDGSRVLPVVFMTGHRDVPASVQAMKNGAVDFLLKPFTREVLLDAVERAVQRGLQEHASRGAVQRARRRLARLSPRERQVCQLVADGLTSREIAERLGIAEGTISVHRAHVMTKLEASSVPELVRLIDAARHVA